MGTVVIQSPVLNLSLFKVYITSHPSVKWGTTCETTAGHWMLKIIFVSLPIVNVTWDIGFLIYRSAGCTFTMQKCVCAEEMKVSWAEIKERVNITIYGFDILLLKIPNQRGKTFFFSQKTELRSLQCTGDSKHCNFLHVFPVTDIIRPGFQWYCSFVIYKCPFLDIALMIRSRPYRESFLRFSWSE